MNHRARLTLLSLAFATLGLAQDVTVDQLVERNLTALGGAGAVKAVNTLTLNAKMVLQGGLMEAPLVIRVKRPGMIWSAVTMQGQQVISAWDGKQGWTVNPLAGSGAAQPIDERMTRQLLESADIEGTIGALAAYRNRGATLELLGQEDVEGQPAYKVKITRKDGEPRLLYLSVASYLPVKAQSKTTMGNREVEMESYPSDYRKVGGVLVAFMNDSRMQGKSLMKMVVEQAEVNQPIDDALFRMPAAPAPEAKK